MKKIFSIMVMLTILVLNIGCSVKSEVSENVQPTLLSFKSADINMGEDFSEIICTDKKGENFLIFGKNKSDEYCGYVTDIQFKDKQFFSIVPQEDETVKTAAFMPYGRTAVLSVVEDDTVIYVYDKECNLNNTYHLGEIVSDEDYTEIICCEEGFYIDIEHQSVIFVDSKGNLQGEVDTKGHNICGLTYDKDGNLFVLMNNSDKMYLGKLDTNKITEESPCGELASYTSAISTGCGEYEIVSLASGGLYGLKKNNWEKITDFSDNDFNINYIRDIEMISEEEFVIMLNLESRGYQMRLLTQRDISEIQQKKIIKVALTQGCDEPYTDFVKKYNSESEKYRIEFVDYYNSNIEEEYNQLRLDIISGKCPDIILFSDFYPVSSFGDEQSIFVDFYDLIDNDAEINRSDFLDGFLETMETNGKLLQLNPTFNIETNMIKTKYTNGLTSWNPEVLEEMLNTMPEGMEFSLESQLFNKTDMFLILVDCYQFISKDKSKCSFNSEEFIRLLKEINTLDIGVSNETYTDGVMLDAGTLITSFRNDDVLTHNAYIRIIDDFKLYRQVYSGEDCTFIGYINDNAINAVSHPCQTFGIMANSDNIEGAWDFLKYYMFQMDSLYEGHFCGIPGLKSLFYELIHDKTIGKYTFFMPDSSVANEFDIQLFTDDEAKEIEKFILDSLKNSKQFDNNIDNILREELDAYFLGEKSAEQVAELIQNRVEIYLSEIN